MTRSFLLILALLLSAALPGLAAEASDVYFLGYETEPGMDDGGRTLASLQSGISRAFSIPFEKTSVAPAWELPLAAAAEIDALLGARWGLAAKVGAKSKGFFPGLMLDEGVYAGLGIKAVL